MIYVYVYMYMCVYVYVCICVCVYVRTYIYIYIFNAELIIHTSLQAIVFHYIAKYELISCINVKQHAILHFYICINISNFTYASIS